MRKYTLLLLLLCNTLLQAQRTELTVMASMVDNPPENPLPPILSDTCRVQGYTEKFKLHYVTFSTTIGINANTHGITGTYRLAVKDALRKAVRTYRNPLYSADGIVFRSPIGDGILGGAATGSTENNWINVY